MRRFQSILYVTRGTEDETETVMQALGISRAHGASLHAVVMRPMLPERLADYEAGLEASLTRRASTSFVNAQLAMSMSSEIVHTDTEVEPGEPRADMIVRRVVKEGHDLVIKQAEQDAGRSDSRELDVQLLRLCPCPVWLCHPIHRPREEIRVAVAVDPHAAEPANHELAVQLLLLSRSLANACSGELHIISCWSHPYEDSLRHVPWLMFPEEVTGEQVGAAERNHRNVLDALIFESGITGRTRVHRAKGDPRRVVAQLARDRQIDILVMGTAARRGFRGFIVGNTVESVMREAECSLLAVKPYGFQSPVHAC